MTSEVSNHDILVAINAFSSDVDKRFDALSSDVEVLKSDVSTLKSEMGDVKTAIVGLHAEQYRHGERLNQIDGKFDVLTSVLTEKKVITQKEKMHIARA
jgi:hypothetical protein